MARSMKFFATKLCNASPAQMGYMNRFTTKQTPAPTAISTNLVKTAVVYSRVRFPATIRIQYVNMNTRKPYSYGAIVGYNFKYDEKNPNYHRERLVNLEHIAQNSLKKINK
jgi:hypothetical protein